MCEEERHVYKITPEYKKAIYQEEHWVNQLKNGKRVILHATTFFRWGTFEINLTEQEMKEILEKDHIILNDYESSLEEMWDGCDFYVEIHNEKSYSPEEIKEIKSLIYCPDFDNSTDYEYDTDNGEDFEEEVLESNGWDLDDTIYGISTTCKLEKQS